ncbi:MAG: hypothetical protein HW387_1049 [Parachlamydiales bacterium]|nr:hypothetical protein [Parachlamydiales bacterium]
MTPVSSLEHEINILPVCDENTAMKCFSIAPHWPLDHSGQQSHWSVFHKTPTGLVACTSALYEASTNKTNYYVQYFGLMNQQLAGIDLNTNQRYNMPPCNNLNEISQTFSIQRVPQSAFINIIQSIRAIECENLITDQSQLSQAKQDLWYEKKGTYFIQNEEPTHRFIVHFKGDRGNATVQLTIDFNGTIKVVRTNTQSNRRQFSLCANFPEVKYLLGLRQNLLQLQMVRKRSIDMSSRPLPVIWSPRNARGPFKSVSFRSLANTGPYKPNRR